MTVLTADFLRPLLLERASDSHKGDYGHLLLVAGCQAMPGAAVLATGAALKSGCGLVTLRSPAYALQSVAYNFPAAMLSAEPGDCFGLVPEHLDRYDVIAVGPGLGTAPQTAGALAKLLSLSREGGLPMVLDADALNLLAARPAQLDGIPAGSVMTPHPGELRRLTGPYAPQEQDDRVLALSRRTGSVVVCKGFRTRVYTPAGEVLVNTTSNPGMAKGGSGDVLAGMVVSLLGQGMAPFEAACCAAYLHGLAGDLAAAELTERAMTPSDMLLRIGGAFRAVEGK